MRSSFVRKTTHTKNVAPLGCCFSSYNDGCMLVSSGLKELDEILGKGFIVGSICLVEQDHYSENYDLLLKYFASEAVTCSQKLLVASCNYEEDFSQKWLTKLPKEVIRGSRSTGAANAKGDHFDDIRIAWQYKKYLDPKKDALALTNTDKPHWCHDYDISQSMPRNRIIPSQCQIKTYSPFAVRHDDDPYRQLYNHLNQFIQQQNQLILSTQNVFQICRIVIHTIGTPEWGALDHNHAERLISFLIALKGLMRQSTSLVMLSFPPRLWTHNPTLLTHVRHVVDYAFSFGGAFIDHREPVTPAFKDFDGLFQVIKLSNINSFVANMPPQPTFTFKRKKKKLHIEKIHLPPESSIVLNPTVQSSSSSVHGRKIIEKFSELEV